MNNNDGLKRMQRQLSRNFCIFVCAAIALDTIFVLGVAFMLLKFGNTMGMPL